MGKVDAPPPRGDFDDQREEEEEEEEDVLLVFDVRDLIVFFVSFFFSLWDRKVKNLFLVAHHHLEWSEREGRNVANNNNARKDR